MAYSLVLFGRVESIKTLGVSLGVNRHEKLRGGYQLCGGRHFIILDGPRIGRHCWINVHVSPPLRHDAEIFMPPTTLTSRFGYLAGRLGGPLAPEDMALRINRLGAEGRCAIRSIGESKVWILRDRYASLHFQQKLVALPETQFAHDE